MSSSEFDDALGAYAFLALRSCRKKSWCSNYCARRSKDRPVEHKIQELKLYPEKFYNYVRMSIEHFYELLSLVENQLTKKDSNFRKSITPEVKLFVTLRFLATGNSYASLHYEYRLGKSTISEIIPSTCEVIWKVLQPIHMLPLSSDILEKSAKDFEEKLEFPQCCGAVDGKHIRIQCPAHAGSLHYNYKGYHSIVLQAVAGADGSFLHIDVGDYGRQSDGGVFMHTRFGQSVLRKILPMPASKVVTANGEQIELPAVFMGDEAYRLLPNFLVPYPRRCLSRERRIFNKRLSHARRVVECAFGILVAKWRCLERPLLLKPDNCDKVVLATCILHNYNKQKEKTHSSNLLSTLPTSLSTTLNNSEEPLQRSTVRAKAVREDFNKYFCSPQGSVAWQEENL